MIPVAYHMLKAISVLQARLASRTTISASALEPCLKMSAWAGDIQTALDTLMAKPEEEIGLIDVDVWRQQLPIEGLQCCLTGTCCGLIAHFSCSGISTQMGQIVRSDLDFGATHPTHWGGHSFGGRPIHRSHPKTVSPRVYVLLPIVIITSFLSIRG